MLGHVSFFQENQWIFRPSPPTCVNPDNLDTTNTIVCIIPFLSFYVFWWVYHPKCEFFRYPCLQQQRKNMRIATAAKNLNPGALFFVLFGRVDGSNYFTPRKINKVKFIQQKWPAENVRTNCCQATCNAEEK